MSSNTERPCRLDFSKEAVWERSYLKKKCKELNLEKDYNLYDKRLCINHLGVFFFVHSAVTVIKCIMLMVTCEYSDFIHVDVGVYLTSAILTVAVLSINFSESVVSRNQWVIYLSSAVASILIVCADIIIYLYHRQKHNWIVLPFYDAYVIYVIYLCFPIPALRAPFILATFVSITYLIIIYFYTLNNQFINVQQAPYMIVEILHFTCCHLVGLFYRLLNEITVRSSFIDRHQYVMEKIWLREAKNKEKQLLHGILPPDIARPFEKEIRFRIGKSNKLRNKFQNNNLMAGIMALQYHPDVTILYADVVNYTHLTTTLTVNALVGLLHDLYGRFDVAARIFKVQRIKFLGDCYYCVAGLTRPDPDHAKCCIELAHSMIAHIRAVRVNRDLDIDMRIGVHSGSLMAGVMGAAKLQYDIWGEDVIIAGILESTGRPGHIHISERTSKMLIDNPYELLPGTEKALLHPHLASKHIKTFLIAALAYEEVLKPETSVQTLSTFNDIEKQKEEELRIEFEKLPVGSFHMKKKFTTIWKKKKARVSTEHATTRPQIGFLFLNFRDARIELNYIKQPDYMLRYSVLLAFFAGIFLVYLVKISHSAETSHLNHNLIVMSLLSTPVIILWYKKICHWRYGNVRHIFSRCSCFIFRTADYIQSSLIIRMCIYMNMIVCYFFIIFQLLNKCDYDDFQLQLIDSKLYHYEMDKYVCFYPWNLTNMMSLMIALSIIFTRIPWMVKIIVSVLEGTTYMIIMFSQFEHIINRSSTTNPYFRPHYAHGFNIMTTLGCLYFMERQAEFNSRVNYNWKLELLRKQNDADITNQSITILLQNILPTHVVNIYLTSLAKHQLYAENYKMVAVMFASLQDFKMDVRNLRILNEIITQFDQILYLYKEDYLVDKIKIVGCTYMAACGLDPRFMGRINERSANKASIIVEVTRAQRFLASSITITDGQPIPNEEVVFVLTTFALDLLRTLWMWENVHRNILERDVFNGNMKIGISCGEVMAGVVGASQVHYDIWGTPVNMASRMDSTGVSGFIHVCEDTAHILRKFGIECDYRGLTFVKGLGILPTYFVGVDEDHEFRNTPMRYDENILNLMQTGNIYDRRSTEDYSRRSTEDYNRRSTEGK